MTNAYQAKKRQQGTLDSKPSKPMTWTLELPSNVGTPTVASYPRARSGDLTIENDFDKDWISDHPSMQPRTILGAGLIDHFSTLPIPRTDMVDQFVAACESFHPPLRG